MIMTNKTINLKEAANIVRNECGAWTALAETIVRRMRKAESVQSNITNTLDCISRAAAIKAADSIIERDTSGNNDVVKVMTAWKEYIKTLPPAQSGWIPIGVPMNSGQHYLVTLRQKFEGEETYRVRIMRLHEGHWLYPHHFPEWINDEMEQEVVAWQPLPTPYRKGGQE